MEKNNQTYTVLAIETSCDETAFSIVEATPGEVAHSIPRFDILSHQVHSQANLHAEFGGVFPHLAKREHAKNFVPVLSLCLEKVFKTAVYIDNESASHESHIAHESKSQNLDENKIELITKLLSREEGLAEKFISFFNSISQEQFAELKNKLDGIAVTYGPGLEPALWVGISGSKALAVALDLPLFPINHMEGHIASVLASVLAPATAKISEAENISKTEKTDRVEFPALALLISGGHTEIVHIESWHKYRLLGQTVDDAVGEAYDKVARLLALPYPGGPHISKLADLYRAKNEQNLNNEFNLPRPMMHSKDLNFSFSGLKTAVLYAVKNKIKEQNDAPLTEDQRETLAGEFEQAVVDVLTSKIKKALAETGAKTLIIGGGVISNTFIRAQFSALCQELEIALLIPEMNLATDNASMIALVALLQIIDGQTGIHYQNENDREKFETLKAEGNLSF